MESVSEAEFSSEESLKFGINYMGVVDAESSLSFDTQVTACMQPTRAQTSIAFLPNL